VSARRPFRPSPVLLLVSVLAFAWPALASDVHTSTVLPAVGRCGSCHPAERTQHAQGVHAGERVSCVSCHGGDAAATEAAAAHGAGFKGRLGREAVPALCASCHADPTAMRAYGLPTDQHALWLTSGHAERVRNGDRNAAVCTDCHGVHDIRSPREPQARTFVANVDVTCGRCHGDPAFLKARGLANVHAAWEGSAHAVAFRREGAEVGPTCTGCHGVHGAVAPGRSEVGKVCGSCHAGERAAFEGGPHASVFADPAKPECSACHDPHVVAPAAAGASPAACASCHAPMTRAAILGRRMGRDYAAAEGTLAHAEKLLDQASAVPMRTEDHRERLDEARQHLDDARVALHAVRLEAFAEPLRLASTVADEVERDLEHRLHVNLVWKVLLVVFWFFVLGTVLLLRRMRDRARTNEG
jgi:hypothetical protein